MGSAKGCGGFYLDDLSVEACLPLDKVGDLELTKTLQAKFKQVSTRVPSVGKAVLRFH